VCRFRGGEPPGGGELPGTNLGAPPITQGDRPTSSIRQAGQPEGGGDGEERDSRRRNTER